MTDLTPERRAELRAAVTEDPSPMGSTWWPISGPSILALLDAADERDRLAAVVERVRALHRTVGIFDECDCDDDAKAEGHLDIYEVGTTCNKLYDICDECCRNDGYQTEGCADYHRHGLPDESHLCPTLRALEDGTDA